MNSKHTSNPRNALARSTLFSSLSLALMGMASSAGAVTCTTTGGVTTCAPEAFLPIPAPYTNNANNLNLVFTNTAQAAATLGGLGTAVSLGGNNVTFTNNGQVDPNLLGVLSVLSTGTRVGNGSAASTNTVTNTSTGRLYGGASLINVGIGSLNGVALDLRNGTGGRTTINNQAGGVIATGSAVELDVLGRDAAVITSAGGGATSINNQGTIVGKIALQTAASVGSLGNDVTNQGTIYGSVSLGGGNDRFVQDFSTGGLGVVGNGFGLLDVQVADLLGLGVLTLAADGTVNGGDGYDILQVQNINALSPTVTLSAQQYRNFENLKLGQGSWRLEGAVALDRTDIFSQGNQPVNVTLTADNNIGTGTLLVEAPAQLSVDNAAGVTLNNPIVFNNAGGLIDASLTFTGTDNLTLNGPIAGAGAVVAQGTTPAATLALGASNTYTGPTRLISGTLEVRADNATGTGALFVDGIIPTVLRSASPNGSVTLNPGAVALGALGPQSVEIQTLSDLTINGNITGNSGFVKTGDATLHLNGARDFYGDVVLAGGTLDLGSDLGVGNGALIAQGTIGFPAPILSSDVNQSLFNPIVLNSDLELAGGADWALQSPISGTGALIQNSGALTLGTTNTHSGGTVYGGGQLTLFADNALGTGTTTLTAPTSINNFGNIILDNPFDLQGSATVISAGALALNGPVSGAGSLTQSGSGTIILNGLNTYSGGTLVNSGQVVVGNDNALGTGPVTLNGGALLGGAAALTTGNSLVAGPISSQIGSDGSWLWNGDLSGSGELIKVGAGALTFAGDTSAFNGTVSVQQSDLIFSGPLTATVNVEAGSNLLLGPGNDVIDGSGVIAGSLNLGDGDDVFTLPLANIPNITGQIDGAGGVDQVTVDGLGAGEWNPSGFINFENLQINSGTAVALTGNAGFAQTNVDGFLALGGATGGTAGSVRVAPGGTLLGDGLIAGDLTGEGYIIPGGIAGAGGLFDTRPFPTQLTVGANLNSAFGSQWSVRVNADGTNDKIVVNGAANLNGGQVIALPQAGEYGLSTTYEILSAQGGVTGAFSGVTQNTFAFLNSTLVNTANAVNLILTRAGTTPVDPTDPTDPTDPGTPPTNPTDPTDPGTPPTNPTDPTNPTNPGTGTPVDPNDPSTWNPGNPGGGNNGGGTPPTTPAAPIRYDDFAGLTDNQRNMATSLQNSELRDGDARLGRVLRQVRGLTTDQVIGSFDQLTGETYAAVGTAAGSSQRRVLQGALGHRDPFAVSSDGINGWVGVTRSEEDLFATSGTSEIDSTHTGVTAGFDMVNGDSSWGPFLNGSRTKLDPKGRRDDVEIKSWTAGVQGQWMWNDQWWARAAGGYGRLDIESNRIVQIGGNDPFGVRGDTDGTVWSAGIESGFRVRTGNWALEPFVGAYYVKTDVDGFTERSADGVPPAALRVGSSSATQKLVGAGLNATTQWGSGDSSKVSLDLGVRYMHNFGDTNDTITNSFAVAQDLPFQITGSRTNSSWVEGRVGIGYQIAQRAKLTAGYQADLTGDSKAKGFNLGLRWDF